MNASERFGGLSVCMRTDTNTNTGIDLAITTVGTYRYNFTIPLLSVIGANYDKLFPIGSINNMQLQMTTANQLPIATYALTTTGLTQPAIANGFVLTEFSLNMKYIDIGDMASQILSQTLQDGKWFLKATTYTNSASTIPSGGLANQQLLLQIRNTSVKSLLHTFSTSSYAICPNGQYDSICPNLSSRQLQVGGNFYPNKPINDIARPSEGYQYLIQSLTQGGGITKSYGSVINRNNYCVLMDTSTGQDSSFVVPAAALRPIATNSTETNRNCVSFPNAFYCGYDLEKSAGILFQGLNTRSSPPFLNLYIATVLQTTVNVNAWGMSDVILQVDTIAKQITAFI